MQRAIITGATGAVGTALINELIKHNIEVLVILREGSLRNEHIPDHPLVIKKYCDLSNLFTIQYDGNVKYDVFYHLAWMGTTGQARDDMYLQNLNIKYALDAVNMAKRFGCQTFIGAGSQAEYGRVEGLLKPDTPTKPETGYGIAKLCAGQMTREYAKKLGVGHIWVRILSVYGPYDTENSMVMSTINKLKNNIVPLLTKGEQMWDYLYSADAARAFYLLGEKGIYGKTYVLGSGKAKPLKEYIEEIHSVTNPDCDISFGAIPYAEKQVMHLQADITEIRKDTGFEPAVEFKTGIETLI